MKPWIVAAVALHVLASVSTAENTYSEEVARLIGNAEAVSGRDGKIAYLRDVLEKRGEDPENIFLEKALAGYMSQYWDPEDPQPLLCQEAAEVYESIISKYDYDFYYEAFDDGRSCLQKGQYAITQALIQAGCIYIYELDQSEKGREYQDKAMELLKRTMDRRKADWLREPRPSPPAIPQGGVRIETPDKAQGRYEYQLRQWEERQALAKKGDVLFDYEKRNARIAVKYYGLSYGRQDPSMVPLAMSRILEDFPGTPMAEFAQGHIDKASEIVQSKAEEELDDVVEEGLEDIPEPAAETVDRSRQDVERRGRSRA